MGRTPTGEPRQYQIEQLWDLHHEILRRLLLGQKAVEIARDCGCTAAVVSYVRNSEIGRRQLSLMHAAANVNAVDVASRIHELSGKAIQVLDEAMDPDNPLAARMRAATDILDRAGFAPPKVLRTENVHAVLTAEDILDIKERAHLMAVSSGAVVEAQVEDE